MSAETKPGGSEALASSGPTPSLAHRYGYKLMASAAAMLAAIAMELLLPRALGPAEYGRYNYVIQFFTQLLGLISGASAGFAARVARRPRGTGLLRTYFRWLLIMLALLALFAPLVFALGFQEALWPALNLTYIELGCLAAYFTYLGREVVGIGDAFGQTVRFETVRIVQRMLALLLLLLLFLAHWLNAITAFFFVLLTNLLLVAILVREPSLRKGVAGIFRAARDRAARPATAVLINLALPVTALTVLSGLTVLLDRWLLQRASGDVEQGYFSLAFQMIQAMTLFAAALVPLLSREMSISHDRGDADRLRGLYTRLLPSLAFAVALPSCFLASNAGLVSVIAGGKSFSDSTGAIAPMALVPIYAAYSYVSATVYFATNQLRQYRNIGIVIYALSPFLAWLFVAPQAWFGLEMGAEGLAIKTLLLAFILQNSMIFFNCRYLGISYGKVLFQQLAMIVTLGASALLVSAAVGWLMGGRDGTASAMLDLLVNLVLYLVIAALIVRAAPLLTGVEWRVFSDFYRRIWGRRRG